MTRSQWMAIAGGASMIVAPFLPLITDDAGTTVISLLGERTLPPLFRGVGPPPTIAVSVLFAAVGVLSILFGAAAILFSVWFATARHLILPALAGLLVSLAGTVGSAGLTVASGGSVGMGWGAFIAGNALILAAGIIDGRLVHRSLMHGSD